LAIAPPAGAFAKKPQKNQSKGNLTPIHFIGAGSALANELLIQFYSRAEKAAFVWMRFGRARVGDSFLWKIL